MDIIDKFRYRRTLHNPQLRRAIKPPPMPNVKRSMLDMFLTWRRFTIFGFWSVLIILIVHFGYQNKIVAAMDKGNKVGITLGILFFLIPYFGAIWWWLRYKRKPDWTYWQHYSYPQRFCANIPFTLVIMGFMNWLFSLPNYLGEFVIVLPTITFVLTKLLDYWAKKPTAPLKKAHLSKKYQKNLAQLTANLPFRLWLGESTGQLAHLSHGANVAGAQQIVLSLEDAAQNVLILGAIGSGKTTRGVHPLLLQLLDQGCGGLIFDIKGDFGKTALTFARMTHREDHIITIGPSQSPFNLINGLSPEMASSFLKSTFFLGKGTTDSFWIDTATELCRNALGVLSFIPRYYNLNALYHYLFDSEVQEDILSELKDIGERLLEDEIRLLRSYQYYSERIFERFDEKVKAGVLATISQVLSSFSHPKLITAFCSSDTVAMESVLENKVFLVDLPLAEWGLGAKVICMLLKLRFYNVMQRRLTMSEWEQNKPVFFICDEFQEIVSANKDGLSDLNFWDKSRSSKTIGIISAQSISSFYAAIGDRDVTHALLQNFRQKLCFRTEDDWTIHYCNRLLGQVDVQHKSVSSNSGWSSSGGQHSAGESVSIHQRLVLDAQVFRKLSPNQVVSLLSIQGYGVDDVLEVEPIYI